MSATEAFESNTIPPVSRWRLWIDGCGGFLLLAGGSWTVGGWRPGSKVDVCVRADWPRMAGSIIRSDEDYFWMDEKKPSRKDLICDGQVIPVQGSAVMTLRKPSPMTNSAVLSLRAPHRFDDHIDAVVLAGETILIGPGDDCHIPYHGIPNRVIVIRRGDDWRVKEGKVGDFRHLLLGERMMLENLAITLEKA